MEFLQKVKRQSEIGKLRIRNKAMLDIKNIILDAARLGKNSTSTLGLNLNGYGTYVIEKLKEEGFEASQIVGNNDSLLCHYNIRW
jgi:hypothetical protein